MIHIMERAYEEIIEFIAAGASSGDVVAFEPSSQSKARVADLIEREKRDGLTTEERAELNHYLEIEHLMRLAKARARRHLSDG